MTLSESRSSTPSRPFARRALLGSGAAAVAAGTLWTLRAAGEGAAASRSTLAEDRFGLATWRTRMPAVPGDPIPAPRAVKVEMLVNITIDGVAAGDVQVWAERLRMRPGPALYQKTVPDLQPEVLAVEAGEIVHTADGTDRRLRAGDQIVIPPGRVYDVRNAGNGEALVVGVALVVGPMVLAEWDETRMIAEALVPPFTTTLPGGAARVLLERLTLPPGAVVVDESAPIEGIGIEAGTLGVTLAGDDVPYWAQPGVERTFGIGTMPRLVRPGTAMDLRNAGDRLLVLYRVRVLPAAAVR